MLDPFSIGLRILTFLLFGDTLAVGIEMESQAFATETGGEIKIAR